MKDAEKKNTGTRLLHIVDEKKVFIADNIRSVRTEKPSLLLHACCGPCATSVVERLAEEFNITVFYYNPFVIINQLNRLIIYYIYLIYFYHKYTLIYF